MGYLLLAGKIVKKKVYENSESQMTLETESERVSALEKWVGVHFQDSEARGTR